MKEAKKGKCQKCGLYFYIHAHHILPKSVFGKKGETVDLYPNCHVHFHEYSKQHTQNPDDEKEVLEIWLVWFKMVSVVVTVLVLGILFFWDKI